MAQKKISELSAQSTGAQDSANDILIVVDNSENTTKKVTIDTLTSNLGAITTVGNITLNTGSAGIVHSVVSPVGADAYAYTANGKKIEVRNKVIATVGVGSASLDYTITNDQVDAQSCIFGTFLTGTAASVLSSSVVPHSPAAGSFKFKIQAPSGTALADGDLFTASFVVL